MFQTKALPADPDVIAPDGSAVRILVGGDRASMAHFELAPGQVAVAVRHRTIDELWYFVSGTGQMWRRLDDHAEVVDVGPGVSLSLPVGTAFQFRATGTEPLCAVGVAVPAWPGDGEAELIEGAWEAPGPH
jgi:mannose-6-phosphate isomerase-like protein (cupin superfamily)